MANPLYHAWFAAAQDGDLDQIKALLAEDCHLLDSENMKEETALYVASFMGHEKVVRFLVESGADLNRDEKALAGAAFGGHIGLLGYLQDRGAIISPNYTHRGTPWFARVCQYNEPEVVDFILNRKEKFGIGELKDLAMRDAFWSAAGMGRAAIVELFIPYRLEGGLFEDYKPRIPASFYRIEENRVAVTRHVIDAGFAPGNNDKLQLFTCLLSCSRKEWKELIDEFIMQGLNLNDPNQSKPILHACCSAGDIVAVKYLVEQGADVSLPDKNGLTPVMWAVIGADESLLAVVQYLVSCGARLDVQSKDRESVLHTASRVAHPSVVSYLLAEGCEINSVDDQGNSALHKAAKFNGNVEIAELLISRGADPWLCNLRGEMPGDNNPVHPHLAVHMRALRENIRLQAETPATYLDARRRRI